MLCELYFNKADIQIKITNNLNIRLHGSFLGLILWPPLHPLALLTLPSAQPALASTAPFFLGTSVPLWTLSSASCMQEASKALTSASFSPFFNILI